MENEGKILETREKVATIAVKRESACSHSCKECAGCHEQGLLITEAINEIGAKKGDSVIFEESTKGVLKKAFMVYIVPVLFFIVAFLVAQNFGASDDQCFLIGVLGFVLSFIPVKLYDNYTRKKKSIPVIIKIL